MTQQVVFMGTPEFAVPILEVLIDNYHVVGVVTQPCRPSGRGRKVTPSPVQVLAQKHSLEVFQPPTLRGEEAVARIRAWEPDVIVVAAFGQILPPQVLALPTSGCVNVHASLLPRWRGASPAAAAIMAGDEVTGITLMKMDEGLDTGPILKQATLTIESEDTQGSLTAKLSRLGAQVLRDGLPEWLEGRIEPRPQDDASATYAPPISKEQGSIDWNEPAVTIARKVRAFSPWPGAFTSWQGTRIKVLRAVAVPPDEQSEYLLGPADSESKPGSVIDCSSGVQVTTGDGLLQILEVQPAGKRPMSAAAFVCGARGFTESRLE